MEPFTKPVEENESFPKTDLTLVLEGKEIYINKGVLAEHSPVFKAMFTSNFKEKTAKKLNLPGKTVEGFTEFLKCFYPGMAHEITEKNVLLILPIAHEYQSPLKEKCEKFMSAQCNIERAKKAKKMSVYTLLDYVKAAETYDLPKLFQDGIELCARVSLRNLKGEISQDCYTSARTGQNPFYFEPSYLHVVSLSSRYNMLTPQTRTLIAEKRLEIFEKIISPNTNEKKICRGDILECYLCDEPSNSFACVPVPAHNPQWGGPLVWDPLPHSSRHQQVQL